MFCKLEVLCVPGPSAQPEAPSYVQNSTTCTLSLSIGGGGATVVQIPEVAEPPERVGRDGRRRLASDVPLAQRRASRYLGAGDLGAGRHRDAARRRRVRLLAVAVVMRGCAPRGTVDLHVLPQRRGVGVGLVAARHPAVVRLVGGVDVGVLLPVRGVGEAPVATLVFALERLLACNNKHQGLVEAANDTR
jgi:hypothetical protein